MRLAALGKPAKVALLATLFEADGLAAFGTGDAHEGVALSALFIFVG